MAGASPGSRWWALPTWTDVRTWSKLLLTHGSDELCTHELTELRAGVWAELQRGGNIDIYRRNLQRTYVETLSSRVNGPQAAADDVRAFFRGELKKLDRDLEAAAGRVQDAWRPTASGCVMNDGEVVEANQAVIDSPGPTTTS